MNHSINKQSAFIIETFFNRDNFMTTLINANMVSVTRMTGMVLPGMVKRGKGVIINVGSGSSMIPSPLLSVYAASKVILVFTSKL